MNQSWPWGSQIPVKKISSTNILKRFIYLFLHSHMRRFLRFSAICTISKTWKSTHGGVLPFVDFLALAWNFSKSNTHPWVFLMFLKLNKWYHITQSITHCSHITLKCPQNLLRRPWQFLLDTPTTTVEILDGVLGMNWLETTMISL